VATEKPKLTLVQNRRDPEEKTYRAIGRFIFAFSQAEYAIRHYLGEAIGLKEEHFAPVVGTLDVAMLCKITMEVFEKRRPGKIAARIKKAIKEFQDINGVRTRVAHGLWVPSMDGGAVSHISRASFNHPQLKNQAEELDKHADKLIALRAKLERAFQESLYGIA